MKPIELAVTRVFFMIIRIKIIIHIKIIQANQSILNIFFFIIQLMYII